MVAGVRRGSWGPFAISLSGQGFGSLESSLAIPVSFGNRAPRQALACPLTRDPHWAWSGRAKTSTPRSNNLSGGLPYGPQRSDVMTVTICERETLRVARFWSLFLSGRRTQKQLNALLFPSAYQCCIYGVPGALA